MVIFFLGLGNEVNDAVGILVMYISVIYVQLILSGYSRYVNPGSTESDEIGGLITNDRWFLLGWFSSFARLHTVCNILDSSA